MSVPAPRRRRLRASALLLGLVPALGACGGLPTSSVVRQGDLVAAPVVPPLRQHFPGPATGAAPEEIVADFLSASSSAADEDYRAAREFLDPGLSGRWVPRGKTAQLYDGNKSLSVSTVGVTDTAATVRLVAQVTATLDTDGRYAEFPTPQQRIADVGLAKVGGEWRISRLPDDFGLWLDTYYFNFSFRPFSVYYASPIGRVVIPDRRFLPVSSALTTTLGRAQLDPIPAYLSGAVTTGFPLQTRLSADAVPVESGVARVDLTSAALDSRAEDRRAALAQAIATLTQVTWVAGVSLQVDGKPLEVVGVTGSPSDITRLGYVEAGTLPPTWVIVRQGSSTTALQVSELRTAQTASSRPALPSLDPSYTAVAVTADVRELAATTRDGSRLVRWRQDGQTEPGAPVPQPVPATSLAAPSFDRAQGLWVAGVDATGESGVWVFDTRGELGRAEARRIDAPWLHGSRVLALRVSPDSQRIAMILADAAGGVRIAVTGVVRGQDERPRSLTAPLIVGGQIASATDLAWAGSYQLAVLGRTSESTETRVLLAGLAGRTDPIAELPPVHGAVGIVSLGESRFAVVTDDGRLEVSVGAGWGEGVRADALATP